MPSARQLSITADQIGCKITDANSRIRRALDRFDNPMSEGDVQDAIDEMWHAYRDRQAWEKVDAAYEKLVA